MHRKPMVSLLIGSLVFGLVLVSISWLPEVSGWQQGTLPKKRPVKRVKRTPPPPATASKSAEKAKTPPQPPSPAAVSSDVQIKTVSAPGARATIAVFDIVPSEPISSEPIGGQEAKKQPAETKPAETKPAETKPAETKPAETKPAETKPVNAEPKVTEAPSEPDKTAQPAADPQPVAEKPVDGKPIVESKPAAPIGTAVQPVEQQPVVRPAGSSEEKEPTVAPPRWSRFGIEIDLSILSTEKIQNKLKSLITTDSQKTTTGQGGQSVSSKRRPNQPAKKQVTSQVTGSPAKSEEPRVARKTFPFALPPIAVPRIFSAIEKDDAAETAEDAEPAADVSADVANGSANSQVKETDASQPLQFQQLTPGVSSATDLENQFGAAQEKIEENGVETRTFQVGPFQQVKVAVSDKIVRSIQVFFKESYAPQDMAKELGIAKFEPLVIRDSEGVATGRVYPERGATLVYVPDSDPVEVKQLILEPISAASFLQRAQLNQHSHYQNALDDLTKVQQLDPKSEEAHAMEARLLMQMGRFKHAMRAVETAMQLQPGSHVQQLLKAEIQHQSGQWEAAKKTIQQILADDQVNRLIRSQATCLRGDLYGRQGQRDYQKAIQYHLDGIKQARSLLAADDPDMSRRAKRILLDAHLAIANDIAWGDWQNKATVVPKWLKNSQTLLDNLSKSSIKDEALTLCVQEQILSAYMGVGGELDGEQIVEALTKTYNELMESNSDALFKQKVGWMTGSALYCAGRIAQQQGKSQDALRNATDAHHLLTTVIASRDVVVREEILVGDTCFLVGSLHAVYKTDHWEAVNWYERALKEYEQPAVKDQIMNHGLHGERLVSMGLSFWQSGDHQRGLQLTQEGTEMIEKAVEKEDYQSQVLAVPYGNLVAMYRHLENEKLAQQFAERAIQLKQQDQDQASVAEGSELPAEQADEESTADSTEKKPAAEKEEAKSDESKPAAEETPVKDPATPAEGEKQDTQKQEEPSETEDEAKAAATGTPAPAKKSEADKEPTAIKEPAEPATPKVPENPIRKSKKSE
jgi:tetratricopeptide (TPR) repeat protein